MTHHTQYRIQEGMHVFGANGDKVGSVGQVVVGEESREPRFFTIEKGLIFQKDYLVPREAIVRVDDEGAHVALTKERIEELPEYRGNAPSHEDVHRAYDALGARHDEGRFTFDEMPLGEGDREVVATGYVVAVEPFVVLAPEEREKRGFGNEWSYGGPGGNR